jgi:purine-binding chemotaxis protein CheW
MSEVHEDKERYLVYRIKDELYASPLLDFKEVIEFIKPKIVPNMPNYFSGMVNLRGLIIGVIDLRKKLGYEENYELKPSMLICETDVGPLAAIIDKVEFVVYFSPAEIQDLKVEGKVDISCLQGFMQYQEHLISVIDIKKFVSNIEKSEKVEQEKAA